MIGLGTQTQRHSRQHPPGRVGATIARWVHGKAVEHGTFDAELVDLGELDLPLYNEPRHPVLQQYEHEHTRRWGASVAAADAFVLVTPEYNHGTTPALLNALNYVYKEWNYKPAAFVSYGGASGGIRAVQFTKQILNTLKLVPLVEAVMIPMVAHQLIRKSGSSERAPPELGQGHARRAPALGGGAEAHAGAKLAARALGEHAIGLRGQDTA